MNENNTEAKWWQEGLAFGLILLIMSIVLPLINGEGLVLKKILFGIPICIILGMCYPLLRNVLQAKKK